MAEVVEYQSSAPPGAGGVYYAVEDLPGVLVRAGVVVVDVVVLLVLVRVWLAVAEAARVDRGAVPLGLIGLAWLYMVLMKRVVGTAGYLLFGVRVVDLRGRPAGLVRLTWRAGLGAILNPVGDLLWAASDRSRQPLRDKLSGTYVVRRRALPAGRGEFAMASVFLLGCNFVFKEVKRTGS